MATPETIDQPFAQELEMVKEVFVRDESLRLAIPDILGRIATKYQTTEAKPKMKKNARKRLAPVRLAIAYEYALRQFKDNMNSNMHDTFARTALEEITASDGNFSFDPVVMRQSINNVFAEELFYETITEDDWDDATEAEERTDDWYEDLESYNEKVANADSLQQLTLVLSERQADLKNIFSRNKINIAESLQNNSWDAEIRLGNNYADKATADKALAMAQVGNVAKATDYVEKKATSEESKEAIYVMLENIIYEQCLLALKQKDARRLDELMEYLDERVAQDIRVALDSNVFDMAYDIAQKDVGAAKRFIDEFASSDMARQDLYIVLDNIALRRVVLHIDREPGTAVDYITQYMSEHSSQRQRALELIGIA